MTGFVVQGHIWICGSQVVQAVDLGTFWPYKLLSRVKFWARECFGIHSVAIKSKFRVQVEPHVVILQLW